MSETNTTVYVYGWNHGILQVEDVLTTKIRIREEIYSGDLDYLKINTVFTLRLKMAVLRCGLRRQ